MVTPSSCSFSARSAHSPPKSHPPDFFYPQPDIKNRLAEVFLHDIDSFLRASDFLSQANDFLLPAPAIKNQQPETLTQALAAKHQPCDFFLQEQEIHALFPPARQKQDTFLPRHRLLLLLEIATKIISQPCVSG
ncbi:hypothetical protein [Candidatus Electronema sp. TJ]|uniref:hypothetical protein n=1 Tax=Candidatus Electronema sp. TJ TaxID=3401573 RepID=UPI003AA8D4AE